MAKERRPRWASALGVTNIGAVYAWIVIVIIFAIWIPHLFLRTSTAKSILNEYSIYGLMALSIVVPLASGVFDLSIGSTMGLTGVFAAWMLGNTSLSPALVIVIAILSGAVIGVFNGLIVVKARIDSFIGTLATGSILAAVTIGISGDQIMTNGVAGSFTKLASINVGGVELPVFYMLGFMIIMGVILEQTPAGRYIYAAGYNEEVTRLVGIDVDRLRMSALICSGVVAGFAGVVLVANLESADPSNGPSYLIPAFSAAFLGATQFRRGRFNPWGAIVAVLMLGTGSVGLLQASAPQWSPQVFQGVVLIVAVGVTVQQRRARPPKAAAEEAPPGPAPTGEVAATASPR